MIEIHRRARGKEKEIDKLWGDIRPSPTFFEFRGVMSNPEEVEESFTKPMRERKEIIKNIFKNDKLDFTIWYMQNSTVLNIFLPQIED